MGRNIQTVTKNRPEIFNALAELPVSTLQYACFIGALLTYAFYGSPTPDHPGIAELVIGTLLILGAGTQGLVRSLPFQKTGENDMPAGEWQIWGQMLFAYGLSFPLIAGVINGNAATGIARDLFAFLFLCLPLFFHHLFKDKETVRTIFIVALVTLGGLFALRHFYKLHDLFFAQTTAQTVRELTYFANSPVTLWTTLFLGGTGLRLLFQSHSLKNSALALLALKAAAGISLAFLEPLQRASIACLILYAGAAIGFYIYKHPFRRFWVLIVFGTITAFNADVLFHLFDLIVNKTILVGSNNRLAEAAAVWNASSDSLWTLIFGNGWGGTFLSPAVGGLEINFTHNLFTAMLLKTGLSGVILGFFYLYNLAKIIIYSIPHNPLFYMALLGPFLISALLYGAYKSFDFGIILLLITITYKKGATKEPAFD